MKGDTLYVGFTSAEGYYLYRHQFDFATSRDDLRLGAADLPPANSSRTPIWATCTSSMTHWSFACL
ncbi:hypothetical protein ACU8V3_05830 [Cobetia marina]